MRSLHRRRLATYGAVVAGAALATIAPVSDGDIYWHLKAGDFMRATHALLKSDPFTVSAEGRPWIDVHWLFQLAVSVLHGMGGFAALMGAAALLMATAACCGVRTAEKVGGADARDAAAALMLVGLFAARHLVALRPALVTLAALALVLAYLERWRSGDKGWTTSWLGRLLPVVQLIWTNCQGLSYLGIGFIVAYGAGELVTRRGRATAPDERPSLRTLAQVLGACVLASLLTPHGPRGWLLPFALLGRLAPSSTNVFSTEVAENAPPFSLARATGEDPAFFFVILGLLALWTLWRRPRLAWGPAFVLAMLLGLALIANRNILLLYVVAPALLGPAFARRPSHGSARPAWKASAGRLALPALGVASLALAAVARAEEPPAGRPTPFRFPEMAAEKLAAVHAHGKLFAPDHQSGYLAHEVPGLRPYLDTRLVLHTGDEYTAYLAVLNDPARFDELDARTHFDYVVLTTGLPGRYLGLAAHLLADARWRLLSTDGTELLFAREGTDIALGREATRRELTHALDRRYADAAALRHVAYLNLARLFIAAGAPDAARDVLDDVPSRAAAWLRARALFAAGDLAGATALTQLLLGQDARDADGQALAASLQLAQGDQEAGRAALARAIALEPFNPEARELAARLGARGEQP